MDIVETINTGKVTIHLCTDADAQNPRTGFDNVGKLVILSRGAFLSADELDDGRNYDNYSNWKALDSALRKAYRGCELLPVYRFEHGDVSYSTTPYNDKWDSGRVGFILCTRKDMLKNWGYKVHSRVRARECLVAEVETYSQWANGEVYGYVIEDEDGNELDSCWGFYGLEYCESEARERAEYVSKSLTEAGRAEQAGQLVLPLAS
jgi:hypothetical protein